MSEQIREYKAELEMKSSDPKTALQFVQTPTIT